MIEKHFHHPPNPHTPPGIGGRGELEFVRQFRPTGLLMLYHGVTSFLRVGDVSFVDLKSNRVTAIGELKSKPDGPGKLKVTLVILGSDREKFPFGTEIPKPKPIEKRDTPSIDPFFKKTLERQSKEIASVLRPHTIDNKANLRDAYHIDDLQRFAVQLSTKQLACQKMGTGVVLAGCCPYRGRYLSSRIYSKVSEASVIKRMTSIQRRVVEILDPSLSDNGLVVSELDHSIRLGMPPLFWFPCDTSFLEQIYFMKTVIAALLNPAHVLQRLRERGFEAKAEYNGNKPPSFTISKRTPQTVARVEQFEFFLSLIQQRFMREEKIVEMIESCMKRMQEMSPSPSIRTQISFAHFL